MQSAFPALVGFLIILGAACWFDAHASEIANGVGGNTSDQLVQSSTGASSTTSSTP